MKLHDLLKQRKKISKDWTEDKFTNRVKTDLKNYKADPPEIIETTNIDLIEVFNRRYNFTIPLIFTNHESMMASMFDRVPELIFYSRGKDDEEKKMKLEAIYEYLKDKLDLESFMTDAAWWFILSGFVSSHAGYSQKTKEMPVLNEETGEPEGDNSYVDYVDDDPTLEVDDPFKVYFSSESEFSYSGSGVPYYIRYKLMEIEDIKRVYDKEVEADAKIQTNGDPNISEEAKVDLDRVKVYFYYGTLPKKVADTNNQEHEELAEWSHDKKYYIAFTDKDILHIEEQDVKMCRLAKWHGAPNEFFGFGIAKLLQPFQKEKSIRRGQQVRFADVAAFPKILLPSGGDWDKKSLRDPREGITLTYDKDEGKPEYMAAPNLGSSVADANNLADQDAQQASGMMDISQGAQSSSTVDTATGQTIFADAAEKRMRLAKKKFIKFYRENVILLFKLCQENWSSEKLVRITDDKGDSAQVPVSAADLQDIDFDTDIDVDAESVSINKDVLRAQAIDLYDRVKDDPLIERKEVFTDMLKQGFNVRNPERYLKDNPVPAGTQLVDPQTGQSFVVGEAGELIDQATMDEMAQPSGGQGNIPTSQAGVMGANNSVGA